MKIEHLDITHPDYDGDRQSMYRQLFEGRPTWIPGDWLPKNESEPTKAYIRRMERSIYKNEIAPILKLIAGFLFGDEVKVEGVDEVEGKAEGETTRNPGGWWAEFLGNVDRRGTSFDQWASARFLDALRAGTIYGFVDRPNVPGDFADRGAQEAAGALDAYLRIYDAQHAIRWGDDENGNLDWIVFKDMITVEEFGKPSKKRNRWTLVDQENVTVWLADIDKPKDGDAEGGDAVPHGVDKGLPVIRHSLSHEYHALRQLIEPATALVRSDNGHRHHIHQSAYAMLFLFTEQETDSLEGGEGYYQTLSPGDDAKYVAPDGAVAEVLEASVERDRSDLHRSVQALFSSKHSDALQQQSGESKAADWKAFEITLAPYEIAMMDFLTEVIRMVGIRRGEEVEPTISGLDSWRGLTLEALLLAAGLATDLTSASVTARRLIARGTYRRMLEAEATPEETTAVEGEIKAWNPAEVLAPFPAPEE